LSTILPGILSPAFTLRVTLRVIYLAPLGSVSSQNDKPSQSRDIKWKQVVSSPPKDLIRGRTTPGIPIRK
jgi:hypothetical protein